MKKIILILIAMFIWTIQIYSLWNPDNTVQADWIYPSTDSAKFIKVKGNYVYVTGNCTSEFNGYAIMTIKYDLNLNELWRAIYINGSPVGVNGMDVDNDENVYIAGFINNGTNDDFLIIKYDPDFSLTPVWTQTFNGTGNGYDRANAIGVDDGSSGIVNVYVTGGSYTVHRSSTNLDIVTISYESTSGNIRTGWPQWFQNYYYTDGDDEALALAISNTTGSRGRIGVYVAGWADNGPTKKDAQVVYYNFDGGGVMEMHYGCGGCKEPWVPGNDFVNAVVVSPVTGDIFCIGAKWCGESQCNLGSCPWVDCLPSSYEVFSARFYWTDYPKPFCVECSDRRPGLTFPCLAIDECYCDNSRYDGQVDNGADVGNSLVVYNNPLEVPGDFVYATGYTQNNVGGTDYITLKYNHSEGPNVEHGVKSLWCTECYPTIGKGQGCPRADCPQKYNPNGYSNNSAKSIAIDATGSNVFVTGNSDYFGPVGTNIVTIQYSSSGSQVCVGEYYNGGGPVCANSIAVGGNSVYVAGSIRLYEPGREGINTNFLVLKYTSCDGRDMKPSNQVTQKLNGAPENYSLSQNYPNPFNPSTTINYSIPRASNVSIKIYNIRGQIVMNIPAKNREPGYYSEDINATSWASGIYFYRIEARDVLNTANTFIDTKKMLVVK